MREGYYNVTELVPDGWTLREISENCMGENLQAADATYGVWPTGLAQVEPGLTTTCVFTNSLPSIVVTKTATPEQVPNPGADVIFNVSVQNTSKLDPVLLTSLTDNIYGNITQVQGKVKETTCNLTSDIWLEPSEIYNCNFKAYVTAPSPTVEEFIEIDTVTAKGVTDFQVQVEDADSAQVVVLAATAELGNRVWLDLNPDGATTPEQLAGDGLQNSPAEVGVPNVKVELYGVGPDGAIGGGDDVLAGEKTTDANGLYNFTGLTAGKYYLVFTKPAGSRAWSSLLRVGSDRAIDNDVKADLGNPNRALTGIIDIASGVNDPTWDAAIVDTSGAASSDLGDFVWNDLNKNGVQDAGEPGIPNIKVELYLTGAPSAADAQGAAPLATTTTDANGRYFFRALDAGSYSLQFTIPTGLTVTDKNAGGTSATDSDIDATGKTATIVLAANSSDLTWDAGLFVTPTADEPSEEPQLNGVSIFLPTIQR